jgi:hypothetical protein
LKVLCERGLKNMDQEKRIKVEAAVDCDLFEALKRDAEENGVSVEERVLFFLRCGVEHR